MRLLPGPTRAVAAAAAAAMTLAVAMAASAAGQAYGAAKAKGKAGSKAASEATEEELEKIRALPYVDFVEGETGEVATGLVFSEKGRFQDGYTLYVNRGTCRVDLLDPAGSVTNTWVRTPCHHWGYAELRPDGDLLVLTQEKLEGATTEELDERRSLLRFAWDGRLIRESGGAPHHALEVLPDGRILILTVRTRRIPGIDPDREIRDDRLAIMSPDGGILEEHSIAEMIAGGMEGFELKRSGMSVLKRAGAIDLVHANAIDALPSAVAAGKDPVHVEGAILLTLRHQDAVVVIDPATWKAVWAWGQGEISGPHDGSWLDNGHILVFDNGISRRHSRVVEVDPLTRKIVWEYRAPVPEDLFSRTNGAAQRLPNGNTLVTDSNKGRAFEVTPAGEVVWKYVNPRMGGPRGRSSIIKMIRLPAAHVEAARAAGEARRPSGEAPQAGRPPPAP